ncbi:MAG: hypothetical protein IKV14_01150 [Muribaculaceae bacterium]|nr:hypothetical protein [Muribaculaceae bacterium]
MKNKIKEVLENLKLKRKAFCSEADFQFEFAWELQKKLPKAKIRLERPILINKVYYIDIWLIYENKYYPIELKYKTRLSTIIDNGEEIELANHAAVDLGCYAYIKDIVRIEEIKNNMGEEKFGGGFAIMLTNEPLYYRDTKRNSSYQQFKIFENREITGNLSWGKTQTGNEFALKKKFPPLNLKDKYKISWFDYSIVNNSPNFKYTITHIK